MISNDNDSNTEAPVARELAARLHPGRGAPDVLIIHIITILIILIIIIAVILFNHR